MGDDGLTLGIDPTVAAALGYAVVRQDGGIVALGELVLAKGISPQAAREQQAGFVRSLLALYEPALLAIEEPALNTGQIAKYGAGAARATLQLAMTVGRLEETGRLCKLPVLLVNNAQAKDHATGSITADKTAMREAARIRLAEGAPDITQVRRPKEHEADALFIALAGAALAVTAERLAAAT